MSLENDSSLFCEENSFEEELYPRAKRARLSSYASETSLVRLNVPQLEDETDIHKHARLLFQQVVGHEGGLNNQTIVRAINYFDRYIERKSLRLKAMDARARSALATLVASAFHLACKYEEICFLGLSALVQREPFRSAGVSVEAIRVVELDICRTLDWKMAAPTAASVMELALLDPTSAIACDCPEVRCAAEDALRCMMADGIDIDASATSDAEVIACSALLYAVKLVGAPHNDLADASACVDPLLLGLPAAALSPLKVLATLCPSPARTKAALHLERLLCSALQAESLTAAVDVEGNDTEVGVQVDDDLCVGSYSDPLAPVTPVGSLEHEPIFDF